MSEFYPEHAKLMKISEQSQAIGEFLEWLGHRQGIVLCRWQDAGNNGQPRRIPATPEMLLEINATDDIYSTGLREAKKYGVDNPEYESWPDGYFLVRQSTTDLLAAFFGIDQDKLEAEKRAMLDATRAVNVQQEAQRATT